MWNSVAVLANDVSATPVGTGVVEPKPCPHQPER